MRVLCLHGVGSSGAIFEAQMGNFRRELDPSFELIFVDGPFECERGPGVSEYRAGPFFSHTQGYAPFHIAQAVDWVQDLLEDEGPFDGIFGFSQGAALTLSYLYQQQVTDNSPQIKFACLFSAAIPLSTDVSMGDTITSKLRALEYDMMDRAKHNSYSQHLTLVEQQFVDILQQTVVDAAMHDSHFPWVDLDVYRHGEHDSIPRVMIPSLLAQKIDTPTIHVWGRNDFNFLIKMSEVARSICDEDTLKTVVHSGLHDLPKKQMEIKAVLRQIEWALNQA